MMIFLIVSVLTQISESKLLQCNSRELISCFTKSLNLWNSMGEEMKVGTIDMQLL